MLSFLLPVMKLSYLTQLAQQQLLAFIILRLMGQELEVV